MDLVQRELTKLATAAVIVDEMAKAAQAQTQPDMSKQAKMNPGLIALLAALGLGGAAAGAAAGGAFEGPGANRSRAAGMGAENAARPMGPKDFMRHRTPTKAKSEGYDPRAASRGARSRAEAQARSDRAAAGASGSAERAAREYANAIADSIFNRGAAASGNPMRALGGIAQLLEGLVPGAQMPASADRNGGGTLGGAFRAALGLMPGV